MEDTVLGVRADDAGGGGEDFRRGIGDGVRLVCCPEHGQVVEVVALVDDLVADTRAAIVGSSASFTLRVTMFDPAINLGNVGTVTARPVPLITIRPSHAGERPPLRVKAVAFPRDTPEIKHVGLFSPLHHRASASPRLCQTAGLDDVLFTDPISTDVSEGSTWNIGFIAADGTVVWPNAAVLAGVTMALLRGANYRRGAKANPLDQIGRMQAAFVTNASIGVRPISAIDGHHFDSEHPAIAALQQAYAAISPQR